MGAAAAEADRTLFVGNLDPKVTEELIFELFHQVPPPSPRSAPGGRGGGRGRGGAGYGGRGRTKFRGLRRPVPSQAGPVVKVKIPRDRDGRPKQFAFVNFKHEESVPYGLSLLNGIKLYGRPIKIQFRSGTEGRAPGRGRTAPAAPARAGWAAAGYTAHAVPRDVTNRRGTWCVFVPVPQHGTFCPLWPSIA